MKNWLMICLMVCLCVSFLKAENPGKSRTRALVAISASLASLEVPTEGCRCGDACPAGGNCETCSCAVKARTIEVKGVSACADGSCGVQQTQVMQYAPSYSQPSFSYAQPVQYVGSTQRTARVRLFRGGRLFSGAGGGCASCR